MLILYTEHVQTNSCIINIKAEIVWGAARRRSGAGDVGYFDEDDIVRGDSRIGELLKEFGSREDWVTATILKHQLASVIQVGGGVAVSLSVSANNISVVSCRTACFLMRLSGHGRPCEAPAGDRHPGGWAGSWRFLERLFAGGGFRRYYWRFLARPPLTHQHRS